MAWVSGVPAASLTEPERVLDVLSAADSAERHGPHRVLLETGRDGT